MKFLYYLAAIGNNNYDTKINILFNNIKYIYDQLKEPIDIIINAYDKHDDFFEKIKNVEMIRNCYIHYHNGILVELWKTNPYNNIIRNYDVVLLNYDDIELININIVESLCIINKYKIDILSSLVINATHKFMEPCDAYKNVKLLFTNAIEIFSILMKPDAFLRYLDYQDINNKWTWGSDFLLGHVGFRNAINCKSIVKHYYKQTNMTFSNTAYNDMLKFINKYGYTSLNDIVSNYNIIISKIDINSNY